jgi:FkbH-like protein
MTLHARLIDKFGDNGIICVIICRATRRDTWTIDSWLMSCRVLGRRVEQAVLAEIVLRVRAVGITTLEGIYLPTDRNDMVREHYGKLGFTRLDDGPDGSSRWEFRTDVELGDLPMTVQREEKQFEPA